MGLQDKDQQYREIEADALSTGNEFSNKVTVVPSAYHDDFGGRPGLDAETRLTPVDVNEFGVPDNPDGVDNSVVKLDNSEPVPPPGLAENKKLVEQIQKLAVGVSEPRASRHKSSVRVEFCSNFGTIRTKFHCCEICGSHITLVYAVSDKDDDLPYEPPISDDNSIEIKIEGVNRTFNICNLGLKTKLKDYGIIILVLPITG